MVRAVEAAASARLGRPWTATGFTDLDERASHPAGIFRGAPFSVFAKFGTDVAQFTAEVRGLTLLAERAGVATPAPVGDGVVPVDGGALLLLEAVPEVPPEQRSTAQWESIGLALAALHGVGGERFGLEFDGYFGPLPQDNTPSSTWESFYAQRRLLPRLTSAVDSGRLPADLAAGVERVAARLPLLCGPPPRPALLHGDAQQNNFLTSPSGAVLLDVAPYYGHPELDLALLDYFAPVPPVVFDAYRSVAGLAPGFGGRRELWRLFAYLAVITVDGGSAFGCSFLPRIAEAVARYG